MHSVLSGCSADTSGMNSAPRFVSLLQLRHQSQNRMTLRAVHY